MQSYPANDFLTRNDQYQPNEKDYFKIQQIMAPLFTNLGENDQAVSLLIMRQLFSQMVENIKYAKKTAVQVMHLIKQLAIFADEIAHLDIRQIVQQTIKTLEITYGLPQTSQASSMIFKPEQEEVQLQKIVISKSKKEALLCRKLFNLTETYQHYLHAQLRNRLNQLATNDEKGASAEYIDQLHHIKKTNIDKLNFFGKKIKTDQEIQQRFAKFEAINRLLNRLDVHHLHSRKTDGEKIKLFYKELMLSHRSLTRHQTSICARWLYNALTYLSIIGIPIRMIYSYTQSGSYQFWQSNGGKMIHKAKQILRSSGYTIDKKSKAHHCLRF